MERKISNKSKKSKKIMRRNTLRRNTLRRKRSNRKRSKRRTIKGGASLFSSAPCPSKTEAELPQNIGMPNVIEVIAQPAPDQPTKYKLHFPKAIIEKLVKALCAYIKSFIKLQDRYTAMKYTETYAERFASDILILRNQLSEFVTNIPWADAVATNVDDAKVTAAARDTYDVAAANATAAKVAHATATAAYATAEGPAIDANAAYAAVEAATTAKDAAAAAADAAADAADAAAAVYIWSQGASVVATNIKILYPEKILSNTVTDMFPDITITKRFKECTELLEMINNIINAQNQLMHSLVNKWSDLTINDVLLWPRLEGVSLTTWRPNVDCDKRVSEINKLLQWFTVPNFSETDLVSEVYVSEVRFAVNRANYPYASYYVQVFKQIFRWIIDGLKR